jgi:uncharacterized membrane protein YfcA
MDWLYAKYTIAASGKQALTSALYAAGIFSTAGFVTVAYNRDPWLLLPAVVGAFAGTYIAVRGAK